jgi:hypothetical protein
MPIGSLVMCAVCWSMSRQSSSTSNIFASKACAAPILLQSLSNRAALKNLVRPGVPGPGELHTRIWTVRIHSNLDAWLRSVFAYDVQHVQHDVQNHFWVSARMQQEEIFRYTHFTYQWIKDSPSLFNFWERLTLLKCQFPRFSLTISTDKALCELRMHNFWLIPRSHRNLDVESARNHLSGNLVGRHFWDIRFLMPLSQSPTQEQRP